MSAKTKISPDTNLKELLKNNRAKAVLKKYGIACFECGGLGAEKLVHAADCHGIDVDRIIKEITSPASSKR